jgi:hypothetical protein
MKEMYVSPVIEVVAYEVEDVITESSVVAQSVPENIAYYNLNWDK